MTKSELIQKLALQYRDLYLKDLEAVVDEIITQICSALENGDRVEIRGFGTFCVKHRKTRQARNPKTGEKITVKEKWVPAFKTGKELRKKMNSNNKPITDLQN